MPKSIIELQNEEHDLDERLSAVRRELRAARIAAAEFKVGDVVEAKTYNNGWRRAIVDSISFRYSTNPSYDVRFQNKGGEWSKQVRSWVTVRALTS